MATTSDTTTMTTTADALLAETLQALERSDVFSLERIHRMHGLVHLQGINIDAVAANGHTQIVRLLCEHAGATYTTHAMDEAAADGHLAVVRYLHETHHAPYTTEAMDVAAENGHWEVVLFLLDSQDDEWELVDKQTDHTPHKPYTTRVMDTAALEGRLDLVIKFHRAGLPCSTWAMDNAAACGHFDVVKFLDAYRREGCTTNAMDEAAKDRHFDIVRFLHMNRSEGCTTDAMDNAAANGDLETVKFLHTYRHEGCTTNAIDFAAANGHTDVVEFLLRNRTEGFTCRAVEAAAKQGCDKNLRTKMFHRDSSAYIADHRHLKILHMLFFTRPDLFDPSVMTSLLECGAFTLWLELRQAFPDQAGEEAAMMIAGERGHLSTIRFLREVENRRDLIHLACAGACNERPSWPTAMFRDDPNGAYDCSSYVMTDGAASLCETWRPHSFYLEEGVPDWMIEQSLIDFDIKQHNVDGDEYPCNWTWPIWAIYRKDMDALETIRRLESTIDHMCDPRFSFEEARTHAIRVGRLDILQWLFTEIPHVAVEPTLLDDAIFYGKLEIAKWLAYNHPDACEEFPGAKAWPLAPLGVRLSTQLLDELENDARLRVLVDFGAMAAYAAEQGNLPLLERLFTRYPASVLARQDIVDRTVLLSGGCCDLSVLKYLKRIGYVHASTLAMDSVTSDSQLSVLQFLFENYRHGDSTLRGLVEAAKHGSWNIVLFYLQDRGFTDSERAALNKILLANADEDWATQLIQLMEAKQHNDDHQLSAEWLSDSEM